jgi:predicted Zn-dependent protease
MSRAEARAARPLRIKVVTVTARDNIERLAARMGYADRQIERFRVLNGLDANDKLKPGDVVKIVVE